MYSSANVILASIGTMLESLVEAILKRSSVKMNFKSQLFKGNDPTISFRINQNCFKTY